MYPTRDYSYRDRKAPKKKCGNVIISVPLVKVPGCVGTLNSKKVLQLFMVLLWISTLESVSYIS
jgi:hypothetical protein